MKPHYRALLTIFLTTTFLSCSDTEDHRDVISGKPARESPAATTAVPPLTMAGWVDEFVDTLGGKENPVIAEIKDVAGGDIDHDSNIDSVVVFAVAGSDSAITDYVAVFLREEGRMYFDAVTEVGETGRQFVDSILAINQGTMTARVSIWRDGDPLCCPSDREFLVIHWQPGRVWVPERKRREDMAADTGARR